MTKKKYIEIKEGGETRCPKCNRLFFKGSLAAGSAIEIKCIRCRPKKKYRFRVV